jgi:hypothetical protein
MLLISQVNKLLINSRLLEQLIKFCEYKNSKIISGYYLNNINNINGTVIYLDLKQQQNITQDFRVVSIKRNLNL